MCCAGTWGWGTSGPGAPSGSPAGSKPLPCHLTTARLLSKQEGHCRQRLACILTLVMGLAFLSLGSHCG